MHQGATVSKRFGLWGGKADGSVDGSATALRYSSSILPSHTTFPGGPGCAFQRGALRQYSIPQVH